MELPIKYAKPDLLWIFEPSVKHMVGFFERVDDFLKESSLAWKWRWGFRILSEWEVDNRQWSVSTSHLPDATIVYHATLIQISSAKKMTLMRDEKTDNRGVAPLSVASIHCRYSLYTYNYCTIKWTHYKGSESQNTLIIFGGKQPVYNTS